MRIARYKRFWGVYETSGDLLCVCVYKKGALAVATRLLPQDTKPQILPDLLRKQTARTSKVRYEAHAKLE